MTDEPKTGEEERNPDGSPKRDLRYSSNENENVRVDRSLDGSGHLARGDKTKMSVVNFSSRHPERTERDPEFEFRPPPSAPAPASPAEAASPEVPPAPAEPPADPPTMTDRVRKFLGL